MEPIYLIFVLLVALQFLSVPVVIYIIMKRAGRAAGNPELTPRGRGLQRLSDALGLPLVGGEARYPNQKWLSWLKTPVEVVGSYRGRELRIYHYTVGSGKNSTQYCGIRVEVNNRNNRRFSISSESAFSKMGKALGMRDAETGNPRFDELFYLRSDDPNFFKVGLIESIQDKIIEMKMNGGGFGRFSLSQGDLLYAELGEIRDDARIDRFLQAAEILLELADAWEIFSGER